MTLAPYLAFCGLCLLLALTPGPDTFLILRFSMRRASSIGSGVGSIFWAVLVGIGLAALLEQSEEAYRMLKILGGLYLVYLGIQAFRHSRNTAGTSTDAPAIVTRARFSAFGARSASEPLRSVSSNRKHRGSEAWTHDGCSQPPVNYDSAVFGRRLSIHYSKRERSSVERNR